MTEPPWFPAAFVRDLVDEPRRITIHDRGYVLFRTEGSWQALRDRCPHRAARLSDGTVRDGRLECLYHGWQFGRGGSCVHIPQRLERQSIPSRAHAPAFPVREAQGILWLQPTDDPASDDPASASAADLPLVPAVDDDATRTIDFMIDLPYEQSFLVENVIDIAHIHVAHHGVRGGGHRDRAAPLDFEISERRPDGFTASFRSVGLEADGGGATLRGARVSFVAPNLVHYESLYDDPELCSGLALYSVPLGRDRCRLLYRAYNNFPRLRDRLRPRWLEHWTQCTILEQDMDVVQGQVEEILSSGRTPRQLWMPLKSSDALVVAYRRWLDEYRLGGRSVDEAETTSEDTTSEVTTARVGFDIVRSRSDDTSPRAPFDRLTMHTAICSSCSRAHQRLLAARTPLTAAAFTLLAVAAAGGGLPAAGLALALGAGRLGVDRLERRFRGRGV